MTGPSQPDLTNQSDNAQPPPALTGASVTPVYTHRRMTMYALTESEVSTISQINTDISINFSVSSFLTSIGIGVYTNAIFYDKLNSAGQVAHGFAAPLVLGVGIMFGVRGWIGVRRRSQLWTKLKAESAHVTN